MKMIPVLLLLVSMLFAVGCVAPYGAPVYGWLITSDVQGPVAVGDPNVKPEKTGTSSCEGIIFFASGDASIQAAMAAGGITKVHHVDSKVFSVLGLYTKWETIVYGE